MYTCTLCPLANTPPMDHSTPTPRAIRQLDGQPQPQLSNKPLLVTFSNPAKVTEQRAKSTVGPPRQPQVQSQASHVQYAPGGGARGRGRGAFVPVGGRGGRGGRIGFQQGMGRPAQAHTAQI